MTSISSNCIMSFQSPILIWPTSTSSKIIHTDLSHLYIGHPCISFSHAWIISDSLNTPCSRYLHFSSYCSKYAHRSTTTSPFLKLFQWVVCQGKNSSELEGKWFQAGIWASQVPHGSLLPKEPAVEACVYTSGLLGCASALHCIYFIYLISYKLSILMILDYWHLLFWVFDFFMLFSLELYKG